MKKLLAILLTLLMITILPVVAFAEEANTSEEATTVEEVTSADVSDIGGAEGPENTTTEETDKESSKITFGFFPSTLAETLPIMGMGMLGIFLVTLVIIIAVLILSKIGKKSEDE